MITKSLHNVNSVASPAFSSSVKKRYEENPISENMEKTDALRVTFLAGLGVGARALWYLSREGFVWDILGCAGEKLVKKNKGNVKDPFMRTLFNVSAWIALSAAFVGFCALIYTAFNAPKANYDGKVNAFKKTKDMDAYIIGNRVEKDLYNQMNEEAQKATSSEEKKQLSQQYLKLKAAKNEVPDFINLNRK